MLRSDDTLATVRTAGRGRRIRVWDPATRLFHWVLVACIAVSLYTGLTGGFREMEWHTTSGTVILGLVLFRLAWGVVGSPRSRFADFVRGPRDVLAYAREVAANHRRATIGHNPMGGWSVLAMLVSLLVQAVTGLFANDDIFTEGPLAAKVSKSTSDLLTAIHNMNANVLMALVALHLAAVLFHVAIRREHLIRPMITGRKRVPPGLPSDDTPFVGFGRALAVAAVAAAVVYGVVTF